MADLEKIWANVFDKGSKKAQDNLRKIHANNPRFQTFLNNRGEQGGSPSAAAAKKVKVEPRKIIAIKPDSVRALNAARQQAYLAKGGRQPIGAMGSGGSNVMAGGGQSTVKDLKASIKAGFNPRVSLDPYESERAKKTGPRSLKMKNEEVQVDEAMSPEAAKKKRIFDLKLKMIKKVANYKSRTKSSKVDEPHSSLNPASDMKLNPKAPSGGGKNYYKEETQIDEVTGYEGVKDRKDIIKRAAAMNRMGKDVFLARVKTRAAEIKKEKASKELAKEEVQIDEVSKKEAEAALGGPVKDKPKGPAGKLPLGYRMARSAARRAMKGAVSAVHKSMEKTMQKEDVNEAVKDAADVGEYDYEGDMAKSQLRSIMANSKRMHDMLEENTNLPEWVQSKITLAEDYISTASNYMQGEMNEEVKLVNEGATHWEYTGTVNDKDYSITIKRGGDLSSVSHKTIMRQNPHLEPHEAKAVHETSGEDEEHVEVEHEGKKYTHHVVNHQEPRMVYGEEVEHIEEKAPPGAKFERMVKHIKKGYAKDGLTKQEKSIAYATAWKAYGKKNEEVEQIDEQSPAEIKAKYYHDQFDKVKSVKAYDKEGKLVGRYRSMDHAKQMKPGHTYKVEEEVEQTDEAVRAWVGRERDFAIRRPADQAERDKLASDITANRKYNKGKKIGASSGSVRKNASGLTPSQRSTRVTSGGQPINNKELGNKQFAYEEVEQVDEKVEIFHKQNSGGDMERYKKDTSNPAAVLARKKAADAARQSRAAGDLKSKNMGQTASTGNGGAVKAVSTTSQGFKKGSRITEAEGKVAVTPKEKSLAAHHGDPKRITYGDVIKARLKSAAAKKMGK